ncbi:apolipoprotein N-acyltransferase [Chitinophaga agrisoli]|uniref:Apolipoprotein N-acyltransferase n=1 Tax=Chitinophaga agrisoli TaxID=2607653 RepID=A0A5B2VQK4_9BACT|nr:apolipoprotein N-acyltransferase [Chitinophaga agrisoli]KAA2240527.1 apolipoprotein N-acyltransferase [Chitinophaga agrisoli]
MAKRSIHRLLPSLLAISSGLLLWAAWPTSPLTLLVFIAFIPLLYLTDLVQNRWVYFGCVYLAMVIWNVATTWWVGNTPLPASGIAANTINALIMCVPWLGFKNSRKRFGVTGSYVALIVYWLTFEYIHLNWELSWPWLTLGNIFAMHPNWVQWYEYTGASGGTLWILVANIALYSFWRQRKTLQAVPLGAYIWKSGGKPIAVIIVPFLFSLMVGFKSSADTSRGKPLSIVIVQPNIDPYDKFADGAENLQLEKFLSLTRQQVDSNTAYIVWPETALFPHGAWEHQLNEQPAVQAIRQLLRQYPKAKLITGATTLKRYMSKDEAPYSARPLEGGVYFDAFNTGLQIDTSSAIQIYHKSKLVPGVELVPYSRYLTFMESWALDMGGITGSYGRTPGVEVLENTNEHIKAFPTICYESIYGEFIAEHVRLGANLLFIITNDGWWGNTEGHRQHLQYARLRAIETRRWIARSANTGVSCFVDPMGNIKLAQPYWEEAVIKSTVTPGNTFTFYVQYGDLLSKGAVIFCILLIVYSIILRFTNRKPYVEGN